jgi:hypothetical protein
MHIIYRKSCRVCGSHSLIPVIDLGEQYLQGSFIKEGHSAPPMRKIPTQLVRCDVTSDEGACGLLQLAHTLPAEILYANYWYRSGTNATMKSHLKGVADSALAFFPSGNRRVMDIGCNDGTLLDCYPSEFEKFGVDPSDIALEIPPPVVVISGTFPSPQVAELLGARKMDVVTSIAMFYDLEDPVGFASSIRDILSDEGVWIVEMSYLPLMLDKNSFDTICHEHLEYYSLAVLEHLCKRAGLRVFRAELNDINGGSIRCYVTHENNKRYDTQENKAYLHHLHVREFELELDTDKPYLAFQERVEKVRSDLNKILEDARSKGEVIHVYGASTKGNVLLQWCGIDETTVACAADRNPAKWGARTLGTNIPIIDEISSRQMKPDYYLVLPWHFKAEFLRRESETIRSGTKMIFPLPEPVVVDRDNLASHLAIADLLERIEI